MNLTEILSSEQIVPRLAATDRWAVIDQLIDVLVRTHKIRTEDSEAIRKAVKDGADNYLAKPANVESILAALQTNASELQAGDALENPVVLSVDRLEWEHIQRVLAENGNNISATARALNMHRRTLQRILAKRSPR